MDLKFRIIADAVSAGWDKSKSLIDNLKAKFNSMFDGTKAGWAKIGAAAIAAGTAMYKIGEAWRQSFLSELKTMADALENFVQDSNRNLRKIKFQDTDTEKARNLEDIGKQIRERKKRIEEINASQDTESILGRAFLDPLEKTGRKITGRGFTEAEEVEREKLQNEVRQLEKQYLLAAGKKTKDEAEAAGKATAAKIDAAKKAHDAEMAWREEEEKALEEKNRKELDAFKEQADAAERLAETRARLNGLVEDSAKSSREFAYSQASPADQIRMDQERMRELGKRYNARDGLGQFAASPEDRAGMIREGFDIKGRMASAEKEAKATIEAEKKAKEEARKANAGRSLSAGDLFTNLYGQNIQKTPEREQADSLKEAVEVLKAIEKKTGASA